MNPEATRYGLRFAGTGGPVVRFHAPDPRLAAAVQLYYFTAVAGAIEDRLYPEWGNLRFAIDGRWNVEGRDGIELLPHGGALYGPTDRWTHVTAEHACGAGVLLTALGWERLIGTPAHLLANGVAPLNDMPELIGRSLDRELRGHDPERWTEAGAATFDRVLLARLDMMPGNADATVRIEAALRARPADTAAFARAAGVSGDVLRHVCRRAFGFGPKRLLRRQRLMDTIARIRAASQGTGLGTLHGADYADQPHFTREFRHFMHATPSTYLAADRPLLREVEREWPELVFPITARNPREGTT